MANDATGNGGFSKTAPSGSGGIHDRVTTLIDLKERLGPTVEKILDFTKKRPATSLVIAIAAGMLIARRR